MEERTLAFQWLFRSGALDLQVSSYDYDALLTEAGEPTDKYYQVQKP